VFSGRYGLRHRLTYQRLRISMIFAPGVAANDAGAY